MANQVPDRAEHSNRKVDMNNPCPTCGMIHVDPNFDYEKHAKQTGAARAIGQALFGKK